MGALTNAMNRLCGEIRTLRRTRHTLMSELARSTRQRRKMVSEMRAGFARAHARLAKDRRADRSTFLRDLRMTVAREQQELRADLAGVRRAWCGASPAVKPRRAEPEEGSATKLPSGKNRKKEETRR